MERNLRLEQVDHVALGYVIQGIPARRRPKSPQNAPSSNKMGIRDPYKDPNYRAQHVAFVFQRWLTLRELERGHYPDWEQASACENSPAQVRACLKELRDEGRPRRRGRPRNVPRRERPITDYQIDSCFRRIKPTRV
jgi:hypothetical protein